MTLPPLREVIKRYGLSAKKTLGQNFLLDLNLLARIAGAAGVDANTTAIEIGAGPGGLTRALLDAGAARVVAIERDERFRSALDDIAAAFPGRLEILMEDARRFDAGLYAKDHTPACIVGNLPFNIATPLIVRWLSAESWPPAFAQILVMVQDDVAERITAAPGTKAYGRLSILCQYRARATALWRVPADAFVPKPQVDARILRLVPVADEDGLRLSDVEAVTAAAFGGRRKMLRSSLKTLDVETDALIAASELDPTQRAETVPVSGFLSLARQYARLSRPPEA